MSGQEKVGHLLGMASLKMMFFLCAMFGPSRYAIQWGTLTSKEVQDNSVNYIYTY